MNRTEKIVQVNELKKLITQKEKQIAEEEQQFKSLKQELQKQSTSELPILLFTIDETLPMPDDERDYRYEYVYYYPDLDMVESREVTWYSKNESLENVIDMRDFFKNTGVPNKIWPGGVYRYHEQLSFAVSWLKIIIDDVFASNSINSWKDLALLLNEVPNNYIAPRYNETEAKEPTRSLKHKRA